MCNHPILWWLYTWLSTSYQEVALRSSRTLQATSPLTFDDARASVQEASCSSLNSSLEGALVHLVCPVSYTEPLGQMDPLLSGIPQEDLLGLRLEAYMQVFQWDEFDYTRKVGKKTDRDFLYFREWMAREPPSNTSFFGDGRECKVKNGGRPCYQWIPEDVESWWNSSMYQLGWHVVDMAQNVTVGEYELPEEAISTISMPNRQFLQPACENETETEEILPCAPGDTAHLVDEYTVAWQQMDSNGTMIDYLTRFYEFSAPDTISILAVQRGKSFVPWPEAVDVPLLFEFTPGSLSASEMIDAASSSRKMPSFQILSWLAIAPFFVLLF